MIKTTAVFSGFSVDNLDEAKEFYTQILGLELADQTMGLRLKLPGGGEIFIYEKENHQPATFTILNMVVENIDNAVSELARLGVQLEHYDNGPKSDEKGIVRGLNAKMGPDIAWFKDPAGNIISVLQDK